MLPDEPARESNGLGATVTRVAGALLRLDPGALARLRRMDVKGPGERDFWRLATEFDLRTDETGLRFVRILALLAPKGDLSRRRPFHDFKCPLGEALSEAGFSEARLARFLALPFRGRGEALERMARWIAAKRDAGRGVNCADIACLLFFDDVKHTRKLAETYYRRFDRAAANQEEETTV